MKKFCIILVLSFVTISIFAQYGCYPCRPCPPPPRPYYPGYYGRPYYRGSDGVYLAAGIVNLVGQSVGLLNTINQPRTVVIQQPVVTPAATTVIQPQPVVQSNPVVIQSVPSPVVYQTQPTYYYH